MFYQTGSTEKQLYDETFALSERMKELALRQQQTQGPIGRLVARVTGLSQFPRIEDLGRYVHNSKSSYRTPPLIVSDDRLAGDEIPVQRGWVFEVTIPNDDSVYRREAIIYEAETIIGSEQRTRIETYKIGLSGNELSGEAHIWGREFEAFDEAATQKIVAQETVLDEYMAHPGPDFFYGPPDYQNLELDLEEGNYPDELYAFPVGLLQQANQALGTKRQKVVK